MNYKTISLYFIIFFTINILISPSARAQENDFPNLSISSTYTFSLDLDGNCELYTIIRIKNLDDDFLWKQNKFLQIPIVVTSFSKEQPNLTFLTLSDSSINYSIVNYEVFTLNDNTYVHAFNIKFFPSEAIFEKEKKATLRAKIKIKGMSSTVEDYNKLILQSWILPKDIPIFKEYSSFIVRVNLPNNPYYWTEILDATPKYDYRSVFGRGESIEWWYNGTETRTDLILIDYRIHYDPLKKDLDNATITSLDYAEKADRWGFIALIIAIVSFPWEKIIKWLIEKINNRP